MEFVFAPEKQVDDYYWYIVSRMTSRYSIKVEEAFLRVYDFASRRPESTRYDWQILHSPVDDWADGIYCKWEGAEMLKEPKPLPAESDILQEPLVQTRLSSLRKALAKYK